MSRNGSTGILVQGVSQQTVTSVRNAILAILKAGRGPQVTVAALGALTASLSHPLTITGCSIEQKTMRPMGGR